MHPTKKYMTYTTSFELKMIYEKYLSTVKLSYNIRNPYYLFEMKRFLKRIFLISLIS